jgi:hypothetical protein
MAVIFKTVSPQSFLTFHALVIGQYGKPREKKTMINNEALR